MTVRKCAPCAGRGIVWKRLTGVGCEGQPLDDGEEHPTRCVACKGAGYVDAFGYPVHLNEVHLGR